MQQPVASHDAAYRTLFSHPRMVEDLLRGFVHEPWVESLDFATLEKVNATFVSDDLKNREADAVWRLKTTENQWVYVYLLVEFQSTVDPFMAVRMMVYVGLLYQDLIRRGDLLPERRLPPVLPFVAYNGLDEWLAAREIADLIVALPGGLDRYLPRLSYLLLDAGRVPAEALPPRENLVGALVRLEQSRGLEAARVGVGVLAEALAGPEHDELRHSFLAWLEGSFRRGKWPTVDVAEAEGLQEGRAMLAEKLSIWREEFLEEGRREGRQQGLRAGEARVLLRQIELRFGSLTPAVRERVEGASADDLLRWGERLLTAGSLDEVWAD